MPSVFNAVWSCMRSGWNAPVHSARLPGLVLAVAFLVLCFLFPETNARRPVRLGPADLGLGAVDAQGHALAAA